MQKLLALGAAILTISTHGQGTVIFNNRTPTGDAHVSGPDGKGAGAGFTAQLFLVSSSGVLTPLFPTTTFRTTPRPRRIL